MSETRSKRYQRLTALLALSLFLVGAPFVGSAAADDRDDAVAKKQQADEEIANLRNELVGIDAELADLFIELEQVNLELPVAEAELAEAQEELDQAELDLQVALEQLEAAEATQARLASEIETSVLEEEALNEAVGSMARDLYRGRSASPLQLVMTADGTGDITERAASAVTMSRAQTRALEEVRSSLAVTRNHAERQEATTIRVGELKEEAEAKQLAAEEKEAEVGRRVDQLAQLKNDLVQKQDRWDKRKGQAEEQLGKWQTSREQAASRIEQIDEENRQKQLRFAEEQASSNAAAAASSAAGSSGGMFGYPLPPGSAYVTSNYGWRIHPIFGISKLHDGVDFGAACGSPQYAIRSGVVASAYYDSGGGNMVTINHGLIGGSSWASEHLHLQSFTVSPGQQVNRGDLIGWTGSTGNSTGCHLHLSLYKDGSTVDPLVYM